VSSSNTATPPEPARRLDFGGSPAKIPTRVLITLVHEENPLPDGAYSLPALLTTGEAAACPAPASNACDSGKSPPAAPGSGNARWDSDRRTKAGLNFQTCPRAPLMTWLPEPAKPDSTADPDFEWPDDETLQILCTS